MSKVFQVLNNGWSARAEDVEVGFDGPHRIYYTSGERSIEFDYEDTGDPRGPDFGPVIYLPVREWRWQPPHDVAPIADAVQQTIMADLRAAFAAMGEKVSFCS